MNTAWSFLPLWFAKRLRMNNMEGKFLLRLNARSAKAPYILSPLLFSVAVRFHFFSARYHHRSVYKFCTDFFEKN